MEAVNDVVDAAARLLVDTSNTHWPAATLIDYLNEAQLIIAKLDHAASYIEESHTPVAGSSHQELPLRALRLLDITHNSISKRMIREIDKHTLDIEAPEWESETPADDAQMWTPDPTDEHSYYVSPPATAASRYDVKYTKIPDIVVAGQNFDLKELYYAALIDYMVARALSEDGDNQDEPKSKEFYASFRGRLQAGPD